MVAVEWWVFWRDAKREGKTAGRYRGPNHECGKAASTRSTPPAVAKSFATLCSPMSRGRLATKTVRRPTPKRGIIFNMWQRQYKQRCKTTPGERLRGASSGGPVADDGSPADGVQMYKHMRQHVIGNDEAVHLQVPAFRGNASPQAWGLQNT